MIADLKRLQKEFQVNHIMIFVLRGIAQDEAIASIERFAKEVMPAFAEEARGEVERLTSESRRTENVDIPIEAE